MRIAVPESIDREPLLRAYVENMVTFLSNDLSWLEKTDRSGIRFSPNDDPNTKIQKTIVFNAEINDRVKNYIHDEITKIVKDQIKRPKIYGIDHPHYGDAEEVNVDLLGITTKHFDKIITPSGSVYIPAKQHPSFLRGKITEDKANRGRLKKLMFDAKAAGDNDAANYYNSGQSLCKIGMNSYPGAMACSYSFLSDRAGFNSTTSSSRYLIMNAYAQTERLLEGNFYFINLEAVMNHIVVVCRSCPDEKTIMDIMYKYKLYIPTWDDIYEFLNSNYKQYCPNNLPTQISEMLMRMPEYKRIFLYYFSNLKHILQANSSKFLDWIHDFYDHYLAEKAYPPETLEPEGLFKLDGMLVILISTVYGELLPLGSDGKKAKIYDTVKLFPDIAKKLLSIGLYMQDKLNNEFMEFFDLFLDNGCIIPNTIDHKNMFRHCVILSDTDSVVFTTKSWLQWYTGKNIIDHSAYEINAIMVYWLSKALEFILKNMSVSRGAVGEDAFIMKMKNEFFYPSMIQSSLKKHYAGLVVVQEGVVLPKPQSDIKGIQFRGSKLADETKVFITKYIDETNEQIIKCGKVSAKERIWKVVEFEKKVLSSVRKGELNFLNLIPVKNEDEYTDADKSIYFNYQFWEYVFAPKFGNIMIPTKCYSLPLVNVKDKEYLEYLKKCDKEIYQRLIEFCEKYPKKKITRIPINPVTDKIPDELFPIAAIRQIIFDNVAPLHLFLESLGIDLGNNQKSRLLFCEIYGNELN